MMVHLQEYLGKIRFLRLCLLPVIFLWGGVAVAQDLPYKKQSNLKAETPQDTTPVEVRKLEMPLEQQKPLEEHPASSAALEIDGLIVDETITKIGRDFYETFHRQWEPPPMAKDYIILIKERPMMGNGAFVKVIVNEEEVIEYQLQPRHDLIEEASGYTVSVVYEFLVNDQLNRQLEAEGRKEKEVY